MNAVLLKKFFLLGGLDTPCAMVVGKSVKSAAVHRHATITSNFANVLREYIAEHIMSRRATRLEYIYNQLVRGLRNSAK